MNFLAHLHLAARTPESRLGNMLGDFVKGRPDDRFAPEIWEGIMLHRHVDAFTDSHPEWKKSKGRLSPERRRFAGIIVDVFYDHFLARHWERFSGDGETLGEFIDGCHTDLLALRDQAPPDAAAVFERMAEEQWLRSYFETEGIARALERISRRSPVLGPVRDSIEELETHYEAIEQDFLAFYPDLIRYAAALREPDSL